jgi:hypothetical protein
MTDWERRVNCGIGIATSEYLLAMTVNGGNINPPLRKYKTLL